MQGSLILLGAFLIAHYQDSLGFWIALIIGIVGTTLVALLTERVLIRPLRGAPVISLAILTIGVDILLLTELTRRIGSDILNVGQPWGGDTLTGSPASASPPTARWRCWWRWC